MFFRVGKYGGGGKHGSEAKTDLLPKPTLALACGGPRSPPRDAGEAWDGDARQRMQPGEALLELPPWKYDDDSKYDDGSMYDDENEHLFNADFAIFNKEEPFLVLNVRYERNAEAALSLEKMGRAFPLPGFGENRYAFLVAGSFANELGEVKQHTRWLTWPASEADRNFWPLDGERAYVAATHAIDFMVANGAHADDVARLRAAIELEDALAYGLQAIELPPGLEGVPAGLAWEWKTLKRAMASNALLRDLAWGAWDGSQWEGCL